MSFLLVENKGGEEKEERTHRPLPQNPFSEQHGASSGHRIVLSHATPCWKPVIPAAKVVSDGPAAEEEVDIVAGDHHTVLIVVVAVEEEEDVE